MFGVPGLIFKQADIGNLYRPPIIAKCPEPFSLLSAILGNLPVSETELGQVALN